MRIELSEAATDLIRVVNGPKHYYRRAMTEHCDLAALQAALGLGLFEKVPQDNSISLANLATASSANEQVVGQVMRSLATQRVFRESEEGFFQHTATSLVPARDEEIRALLRYMSVLFPCLRTVLI